MTRTITASQAATPTPGEIAEYRESLARFGDPYASGFGAVSVIVELIAADHADCRTRDCDLCRHLRWALAARVAVEEIQQQLGATR